MFDAVTFAVSAACLLAIGRVPKLPAAPVPEPPGRLLADLREGVRAVTSHRWLWLTILLFTFIVFLIVGPEDVLVPVYLEERFDAAGLGAAVLMVVGLLIPGVGDYRAPGRPMLARDIGDGSEGTA